MANAADDTTNTDVKADAAAEKAYAAAAEAARPAPQPAAPAAETAPTDTSKIALAVAQVKAAPKKAARKPVAKKAAPRKASALKAQAAKTATPKTSAPRRAAKAQPVAPTTQAAPKRALPTLSQLKDKIMDTATTTDFTATVKETAAQAQTRAKAAYDKFQAYAGEMTEFAKGNVEALVESGKIVGAGVQDMARGEFEAAKSAFETMTADLKAMAAVKSPTELFKLQGEIARRNFDAAVARASKNAEVSVKLANDAFAPISSRMSVAAERLSNAA